MDIPVKSSSATAFIDAERCIAELQRGRAIALTDNPPNTNQTHGYCHIIQLIESMSDCAVETLMAQNNCQLVITRPRALALGLLVDSNAVCLELNSQTSVAMLRRWAGLQPCAASQNNELASSRLGGCQQPLAEDAFSSEKRSPNKLLSASAALNLAHHAHALPAYIMYETHGQPGNMLGVNADVALGYSDQSGNLIKLSTASIPLATATNAELTVFREQHGNAEHVAITVGQPDFSDTVTVRIHSSCFTGDILGSMKCDCGEQLNGAITSMAENGGGVVLYISQEGRGIGLASKLLAYQLQDQGLDTIEANHHLGFEADERRYHAAVFMLKQLGINSISLMTNNPLKIEALRQQGVIVKSRVPSPATVNTHNARYLRTKRERAGHLTSCDNVG